MALQRSILLFILLLFIIPLVDAADEQKNYIIRVKESAMPGLSSAGERNSFYRALVSSAIGTMDLERDNAPQLLHTYSVAMNGFAARLDEKQLQAVSNADWFEHAYPDRTYSLQTTHTPQFLGLRRNHGMWNATNMGEGVIIGVLDTGIVPEHPSFRDDGMPSPPAKWKGRCEFSTSACNNKLIGARSLVSTGLDQDDSTPIDEFGHGTHTASIAAGNFVDKAYAFGNEVGPASGIAPRAHLAVYKVCSGFKCDGLDIMAGLEAAIEDGVDIVSLSIGTDEFFGRFDLDPVAIGTFAAVSKGIFVSCAAGNYGPEPMSVRNEAPWQLTVAASSIDRSMKAIVKLGNGLELDGESFYQPKGFTSGQLPLVDPSLISAHPSAAGCIEGSLDGVDVRGKIVVCENAETVTLAKADAIRKRGGLGMILLNTKMDGDTKFYTDQDLLPASNLAYDHASKIKDYVRSSTDPTAAIIFGGTVSAWAPAITSFSSRGPSKASPGILKPDITGPGLNVLSAYLSDGPLFTAKSGTSMATPHLSGIAALIKKVHPDWSPAAIKSAMMTTADVLDRNGEPIVDETGLPADLFARGAGHVNPSRAVDPGLVYDLASEDYVAYLCGLGYDSEQIGRFVYPSTTDCSKARKITEGELNYPSITVLLTPASKVVVNRTVTNVDEAPSRYEVVVDVPADVSVSVEPKYLKFSKVGKKKRFSISFERQGGSSRTTEGQLRLVSSRRTVRSPISIVFK